MRPAIPAVAARLDLAEICVDLLDIPADCLLEYAQQRRGIAVFSRRAVEDQSFHSYDRPLSDDSENFAVIDVHHKQGAICLYYDMYSRDV